MTRTIHPLLFALFLTSPLAADPQSDALQPLTRFIDNMNKGKIESAIASCSEQMVIIDNVAPYRWHGSDACADWADAQDAFARARGISNLIFRLGEITRFELDGTHAYAVIQASYSFQLDGQSALVRGTLTAAMEATGTGWMMSGFAFSER